MWQREENLLEKLMPGEEVLLEAGQGYYEAIGLGDHCVWSGRNSSSPEPSLGHPVMQPQAAGALQQ